MFKKSIIALAFIFMCAVFGFGQTGTTENISRVNQTLQEIDRTATNAKRLFGQMFGNKQKTSKQPTQAKPVANAQVESPTRKTRPRVVSTAAIK